MKKILIILFLSYFFPLSIVFSSELEAGKWNFISTANYCYIGSLPVFKDVPEGKKRGETFILVYRMNKSDQAVVQIDAGYPYDTEKDVEVIIDNNTIKFFPDEDSAWAENDNKVILSMKKGLELIVKGHSSRGTLTKDIYTLKGFTAAYNNLFDDC